MAGHHVTVAGGAYQGVLEASLGGTPIEGLVRESTYLWGVFRTRSDQPDIYSVMRRLTTGGAWPARLLVQSNRGGPGMARHRTGTSAARSSDVVASGGAGRLGFSAAALDGAEPFAFSVVEDGLRWSEGAVAEVTGREVTPGLQWCLLPDDRQDGMRYASRIFHVDGAVAGVPVTGFVGCDEVHLAPGRQNYVDDPLTAGHLSALWCTWAAAYDDGTVEAGHAAFGRDGFGFGLRSSEGEARVAGAVAGSVAGDRQGCPVGATVDLDGERWEFVADPRGLPLQPLPGPVRQAEGWFRRVGERRRPVAWCATPEVPAPG